MMTTTIIKLPRIAAVLGLAVIACLTAGVPAQAQGRLKAHYKISMTGVSFGQLVWLVAIEGERYTSSATGKASGVLSVLVNGEGSVDTRGNIDDGRLTPRFFTSQIADDEGKSELRMTFDDGVAKEVVSREPPPRPDRVPVTEAHRHGVVDPLSAMLMTADSDVFASENCNRVLSIYDGRRRYDLALSFKRIDKVAIERSYKGFVLVCGVVLHPVSGHVSNSMLVKYVAGRRDMELWLAPIAGTSIIAPIRVIMPTLIGKLEIEADLFDATAAAPTPIPLTPDPVPR
jgi:hypothetical protein